MSPGGGVIWVIDTSSLINIKEFIRPENRRGVFTNLASVCDQGRLVFPREVVRELKNGVKVGRPDLPLTWAKQNEKTGCPLEPCFQELSEVMNHPVAQLTPDPNQTIGEDDADPHVLATALKVALLGSDPVVW